MDAFAVEDGDNDNYPCAYEDIVCVQQKDKYLLTKLQQDPQYKIETRKFSDQSYDLITKHGKICVPTKLQRKTAQWYHEHLCHPGETRMELTLRQHYDWKGLITTVKQVGRACTTCQRRKKGKKIKYSKIPPKDPEVIPWHTLCIDLVGPYSFGDKEKGTFVSLHCLTMIDPATGWFEIVEISTKRADYIANYLEINWLSRYPRPTEIIMDRGREFAAEVTAELRDDYGITKKLITTRNPQANAIVERVHQTVHNMIRTCDITDNRDLDPDFGFDGILAAVRAAVNRTVHSTFRATPTQLVFGRDALLNVSFEADWHYIKERKQKRILQNNKRENQSRIDYTYSIGDRVMVKNDPNRKHGEDEYIGPFTVVQVNDNGTLRLRKTANNGGAVEQTWNVRNITPCLT